MSSGEIEWKSVRYFQWLLLTWWDETKRNFSTLYGVPYGKPGNNPALTMSVNLWLVTHASSFRIGSRWSLFGCGPPWDLESKNIKREETKTLMLPDVGCVTRRRYNKNEPSKFVSLFFFFAFVRCVFFCFRLYFSFSGRVDGDQTRHFTAISDAKTKPTG